MKKFIFLIFIILLSIAVAGGIFAAEKIDFPNPSYIFYLYYDNGQLFADRDYEIKYDVIPEAFVPENIALPYPYRGEVVNLLNQVVSTFQFDPKGGNIKFVKGKITVKAPYFADGQKVNFYDSQGRQLVSIFVSQSSFCNDDNVCNSEVGEDNNSCPNDCKSLQTPPPPPEWADGGPTVSVPVTPSSSGPSIVMVLIYSIIGGGAVFGGYFAYYWWKEKKSSRTDSTSSPQAIIPPSQLPGNPTN